MHRSPAKRASWPLVAALFVAASSVALGADAPWAPARTAQPAAISPRLAAVEAVTAARPDVAATTSYGVVGSDTYPEDASSWHAVWASRTPSVPAAQAEKPKDAKPHKTSKQTTTTTSPAPAPSAPKVWWKSYQGTNHVWMPTLGINQHVYLFPCSRSRDPDNLVYRWGCAGDNNVYLLGHAYGVFKALHDAYYNGKLQKGMPVVYANGDGVEHLYRVRTWRVVDPYEGTAWAIASQPVPSMTLQTCIGKRSQYRLNVRLVRVD